MSIFTDETEETNTEIDPNADPSKYPAEYFKSKLYAKYLNSIFPDFDAEKYEITQTLIKDIETFHTEYSQCVSNIHTAESAFRELFTSNIITYFKDMLATIYALSSLKDKIKIVDDFAVLANKATAAITGNTNLAVKACINAAKVKWKTRLYTVMVGLVS